MPVIPELRLAPRLALPWIPGRAARTGTADPGLPLGCPFFHRQMRRDAARAGVGGCLHDSTPPQQVQASWSWFHLTLAGFKRLPLARVDLFCADSPSPPEALTVQAWITCRLVSRRHAARVTRSSSGPASAGAVARSHTRSAIAGTFAALRKRRSRGLSMASRPAACGRAEPRARSVTDSITSRTDRGDCQGSGESKRHRTECNDFRASLIEPRFVILALRRKLALALARGMADWKPAPSASSRTRIAWAL